LKGDGVIFANARAKAKENNLLSEERLHRMIECKSCEEALRVLKEVNYGGGSTGDFYEVLREEERIVNAFVRETAAGIGFDAFFLRNDYHNLKALLKAKYAKIAEADDMLLPEGLYTLSALKDAIEKENPELNAFADAAIKSIRKAVTPRTIDVEVDKAMYADIVSRIKTADVCIKEYFTMLIDTTNILSYSRVIAAGGNFKMFEENFIAGGTLERPAFPDNMDANKLLKNLQGTVFFDFLKKGTDGGYAAYETARDDYLLKIFAAKRHDMFSAAPIVGYYLGKLSEIKAVRIVLICLKNNVPREEMKKRVRALYV